MMTTTEKTIVTKKLKYTISDFATPKLRDVIIEKLQITKGTYYNKVFAKIGEKQGFEYLELLQIAEILNRKPFQLITADAYTHYLQNPQLDIFEV
ncbi:MAG: hypothetical protein K0B10_07270 [Vicingaceae bacterium]|nr:hypothetical protein [Vicingaceae bacterium]